MGAACSGSKTTAEAPTAAEPVKPVENAPAAKAEEPKAEVETAAESSTTAGETAEEKKKNMDAFHSALRWGKPVEDVAKLLEATDVNEKDPRNGNQAIHIAAQNGHFELTKWLVSKGANINGQNGKGQTALHMSIEYDIYEQSAWLIDNGADKTLTNVDGNSAITGIDGTHLGVDAFPGPMSMLVTAADKESLDRAYAAFEEFLASNDVSGDSNLKVKLAQTGMKYKKEKKDIWDAPRWMKIVQSVP